MLKGVSLSVALLLAGPVWSQVAGSGSPSTMGQAGMLIPPPLSGDAYSSRVGAETRSNYLSLGLTAGIGYDDNVVSGTTAKPVGDTMYTIYPTVSFDQSTSRLRQTYSYSPGFMFYQPTSALNEANQTGAANLELRMSPHSVVLAQDSFTRSSSILNQASLSQVGNVSGSSQSQSSAAIAPFATFLLNTLNGTYAYQYGRNGMIGGGGTASQLNFPNPSQSQGLYNTNLWGGNAFYNGRISDKQYAGGQYQYSRIVASPSTLQSDTTIHVFLGFYTLYLTPNLSMSVTAGPQYYRTSGTSLLSTGSWAPSVTASMGWQELHTNFAASFIHQVTGGGGLEGAYETTSANGTARWQVSRLWTTGINLNYTKFTTVTPLLASSPGGNTIMGMFTLERELSAHTRLSFQYDRLHQNYSGIAAISTDPDSNSEIVSISWKMRRPLGQ